MNRHYCTHFDHRYLSRGLAFIRSLRRHVPSAEVWALCLDGEAFDILSRLDEPGVHPVAMGTLEADDPELAAARRDGRALVEYYFTCKASLVAHVMRRATAADAVSYGDSDIYFFDDLKALYDEAGNAPVIVTPHRFAPGQRYLENHGHFNAGWLVFRRCPEGLAALDWWRCRCIEWCSDVVDEAAARFADQRYIDRFTELFPHTHVARHLGANLAPWNAATVQLSMRDGKVVINGRDPLLFFHFHGIKPVGQRWYKTAHDDYRAPLTPLMREAIYRPYLEELRAIEREIAPLMPAVSVPLKRAAQGSALKLLVAKNLKLARAWMSNALVRARA